MTFKCGVNNPMYGKPAWNKGITHTDEARKKISKSHKGKTFSEDHKRKISLSLKGHAVSEEQKNKQSKKMINRYIGERNPYYGKYHTEETKRKISKSKEGIYSGKGNPFYGKKHSDITKNKISEANTGKYSELYKGKNNPFYGKHHTKESKIQMSESHSGERSYLWKGGISFEPYCQKFNNQIKESVREKYGRKCIICNAKENGTKLSVHHIDYDKTQGCDDKKWKLVPLCMSCHAKTSHKNREYWNALILNKLNYINLPTSSGVIL